MSDDLALMGERHANELETRVSGAYCLRIFEVQGTLPSRRGVIGSAIHVTVPCTSDHVPATHRQSHVTPKSPWRRSLRDCAPCSS